MQTDQTSDTLSALKTLNKYSIIKKRTLFSSKMLWILVLLFKVGMSSFFRDIFFFLLCCGFSTDCNLDIGWPLWRPVCI